MHHDETYLGLRNVYFNIITTNFKENEREKQLNYLNQGLKDYINKKYKPDYIKMFFDSVSKNFETTIDLAKKISELNSTINSEAEKILENQNKTQNSLESIKKEIDYLKKKEEKAKEQSKPNLN